MSAHGVDERMINVHYYNIIIIMIIIIYLLAEIRPLVHTTEMCASPTDQ